MKTSTSVLYISKRLIGIIFLLSTNQTFAQNSNSLTRSNPESEGVSSKGISDFLDAILKSHNELHSIMILRHGSVIAEGWCNPYNPLLLHNMYSVSKSFTSSAIGFAVGDGLLNIDDKVVSFFPNDLPEIKTSNLQSLSIKDLLTMSAGLDGEPHVVGVNNDNWIKTFLSSPIIEKPGTKFLYNPIATYMLSAIIQKVTGLKTMDYLNKKLFKTLGIHNIDWTQSPQGITSGGWGLRLKTEDMAKFGQFYLQNGKWNGIQLLSSDWIHQATTTKIIQNPNLSLAERANDDWQQGYGYQFWRCQHNAYRADGAWGQFIIVLPEQGAVIVITEEASNLQEILSLAWKYLLPVMYPGKLPDNKRELSLLTCKLKKLSVQLPVKSPVSILTKYNKLAQYTLEKNELQISNISLKFKKGNCSLSFKREGIDFDFHFGLGKWIIGKSVMRGTSRPLIYYEKLKGIGSSKVAGTYYWESDKILKLYLQYIEAPFSEGLDRENITIYFKDNTINAEINNNRSLRAPITLKGKLIKYSMHSIFT